MLFLLGTEMDYKIDKLSAQFVFNNPNQTSACGCGESVQLTPASENRRSTLIRGMADSFAGRAWAASLAEDTERIAELFAAFGAVAVRRMFGGAGVFAEGLMIALVVDGVILSQGRRPHHPAIRTRRARTVQLPDARTARAPLTSYWRMPERLYDDPRRTRRLGATRARSRQSTPAHGRRSIAAGSQIENSDERSPGGPQATLNSGTAATSGSVSQITRLRPLRLAA